MELFDSAKHNFLMRISGDILLLEPRLYKALRYETTGIQIYLQLLLQISKNKQLWYPKYSMFFFFSNVLTIWFKTCFEAMKAVRPFYLVFSYDFDWEKERRLGMEEEGTEWGRWRGRGRERGWERGKEREKKKNFSQVYIPKHRLKLLNVW